MNGSEIVVRALLDEGVDTVFGYPGGAVLPLYDVIFQQNELRHVLVRQEGGAVHMAEGYARSTGKVGVVLVTSGPGATNAVTGLTDALMDSVPVVCLTGQVPTHLIGNDAFQAFRSWSRTTPASPTTGRSTATFLLMDEGSMSIWIRFEFGEKSESRPVMRSR